MESTSPRTVKKLKIITPTGKRTELYRTPRLSVNKHIVHGRTFVKYPAEVASPIEQKKKVSVGKSILAHAPRKSAQLMDTVADTNTGVLHANRVFPSSRSRLHEAAPAFLSPRLSDIFL
jgi:hypothetical protein